MTTLTAATFTPDVLAGRTALVTGGSRGIGAATALALAAAGADVAISHSSSAPRAEEVVRQIEALGRRAAAYKADQGDAGQVAALVRTVDEDFGRLDILVNNAGIVAAGQVDEPADEDALQRQLAVNVGGVTAAIRAAATRLRPGGRIITIGSNLAARPGRPGLADYSATKAAVTSFSRSAAQELAGRGITVNIVQSGSVATELNPEDGPHSDAQRAANALGRYGRPEEIAAAVLYLATPAAAFVTGSVLAVDGGFFA
ncbi:SDR family NAD(P)-dependent oxidoreductase [Streptomyces sp. TLI_171]|uniref:SDR family NAD(P)-dependent oxidoreductase n=1 Tax=Streptomyces sp. TLI_171 TaxID=1938859 RepID=UPI000C1A7882|nr:SDR family oxidoreductase [Streptomyces sp. TLI_171]RKE17063.1 NAD(P)-dependent dehydrogenase (short-subunit alcohol dehydrogenase family) [Streptomyces sp. TLI_171]